MKQQREAKALSKKLILSMACVLCAAGLAAGASFARNQWKTEQSAQMAYQPEETRLYVVSPPDSSGAWQQEEDGSYQTPGGWTDQMLSSQGASTDIYTLHFALTNSLGGEQTLCAYDQEAMLRVFGTIGIGAVDAQTLTLTAGGDQYQAVATQVRKDSPLYEIYGPGFLYCFYNSAGEELTWHLEGEREAFCEMTLTASGNVAATAALYLLGGNMAARDWLWCGQLTSVKDLDSASAATAIQVDNSQANPSGILKEVPTQYHPSTAFFVTAGEDGAVLGLSDGGFPANTSYTIQQTTYVLPSGGMITLAAEETAAIDLSKTGISGDLTLNTGAGSYTLKETALPVLNGDSLPLVFDKGGGAFPMESSWGSLTAQITVRQLKQEEDGTLSKTESNSFSFQETASGYNVILGDALPGTYVITARWEENQRTTYQIETTVFLFDRKLHTVE